MTFEEYALLDELTNYQFKTLGDTSISDIDIMGITENLELFGNMLLAKLKTVGYIPDNLEGNMLNLNRGTYSENPYKTCGSDFIEEYVQKNSLDYELLELARNFIIND